MGQPRAAVSTGCEFGTSAAGDGFRRELVLLKPLLDLLFDDFPLGKRETRGDKRRESVAGGIAVGAGKHGPEVSLIIIFRNAATAPIE